jgi:hypothetical protein
MGKCSKTPCMFNCGGRTVTSFMLRSFHSESKGYRISGALPKADVKIKVCSTDRNGTHEIRLVNSRFTLWAILPTTYKHLYWRCCYYFISLQLLRCSPMACLIKLIIVNCRVLQIQRSWVRFPVLPDYLRSSRSGTGSIQPCLDK